MRFAFLWDRQSRWEADEERMIAALLVSTPVERNLVIRTGDLIDRLPTEPAERREVIADLLGRRDGLWASIESDAFDDLLRSGIRAVVSTGLRRDEAVATHRSLIASTPAFVGTIEVDNRLPRQWAVFDQLPLRYRIVGSEMRLFIQGSQEFSAAMKAESVRIWWHASQE